MAGRVRKDLWGIQWAIAILKFNLRSVEVKGRGEREDGLPNGLGRL